MIIHPSLARLFVRLRVARVRRIFSGRSTRRLLLSILGLLMMTLWLGSVLLTFMFQGPSESTLDPVWIPLGTLALLLFTLLGSNADQSLAFTPAEVDMLFPGPFSRRQLIAYRLMGTLFGTLTGGLIFGIFLRKFAPTFWQSALGAILLLAHVNLGAMVFALIQKTILARLFTAARKITLASVLILVGVGVWWILAPQAPPVEELLELRHSSVVKTILLPLQPLANVFGAHDAAGALAWASVASLIPLGLFGSVFLLDSHCEEVMLEASRKKAQRLSRMEGKVKLEGGTRSRRMAPIPLLGPAGVLVWRQLLGAIRGSRSWIVILVLVSAFFIVPTLILGDRGEAILTNILPIFLVWGVIIVPTLLRFDFRAELDHLELLKSLPLHPFALVLAEILTPVALVSLLFAGIGLSLPSGRDAIGEHPWLLMAVPSVALLIVSIENLSFLLWPERQGAARGDAMAVSGRRMLLSLGRLSAVGVGAGVAFLVALLVHYVTQSTLAAGFFASLTLGVIDLIMLGLVVKAFVGFDVSADLPE